MFVVLNSTTIPVRTDGGSDEADEVWGPRQQLADNADSGSVGMYPPRRQRVVSLADRKPGFRPLLPPWYEYLSLLILYW